MVHFIVPLLLLCGCDDSASQPASASSQSLTFHNDIAPIIARQCASCHHPGGSAPFSLLTFESVKKHAAQIAQVTKTRFMPPWLPEPGYGHFANERRLSEEEIRIIADWAASGAPEGNPPASTASTPQWKDGWRLGEPDLVVQMPQAYTLPAEGKDVYRNFVVPLPLATSRWVKAVELRPGNKQIVHHAFVMFDSSGTARRRDGADGGPGYAGMDPGEGVGAPRGEFLSWQPGATPSFGRSWRLTKGSDMVLQLHMRPGGKPEPIQSSLAFYFTDEPPARPAFSFMLRSTTIDIPAGEKNYIVDSEYTLPVDVELTGILPHAHYLGKQLEAWAILPDQTRQPLILIKNWDFNWQGDYQYATPLPLPRGTRLCMRYSFDNSEQNPRNPNHPPKRVRYGLDSTDEMAELSLQMVPLKAEDLPILIRDNMAKYAIPDSIARSRNVLKDAPDDATAHAKLGSALATGGQIEEGLKELRRAVALEPANVLAHFNLAVLLVSQGKIAEGTQEYEQVLRLDWNHYRAHNNLGLIYFKQGRLDLAARHFYNAIRINPNDDLANSNLARLFLTEGKLGQAKLQLEKLLEIIPDDPSAKAALAKVSEEISKRR